MRNLKLKYFKALLAIGDHIQTLREKHGSSYDKNELRTILWNYVGQHVAPNNIDMGKNLRKAYKQKLGQKQDDRKPPSAHPEKNRDTKLSRKHGMRNNLLMQSDKKHVSSKHDFFSSQRRRKLKSKEGHQIDKDDKHSYHNPKTINHRDIRHDNTKFRAPDTDYQAKHHHPSASLTERQHEQKDLWHKALHSNQRQKHL